MGRRRKPPLGVESYHLWQERYEPDGPDIEDLVDRYVDVSRAVQRYREAGLTPDNAWLFEILGHMHQPKVRHGRSG